MKKVTFIKTPTAKILNQLLKDMHHLLDLEAKNENDEPPFEGLPDEMRTWAGSKKHFRSEVLDWISRLEDLKQAPLERLEDDLDHSISYEEDKKVRNDYEPDPLMPWILRAKAALSTDSPEDAFIIISDMADAACLPILAYLDLDSPRWVDVVVTKPAI